MEIEIGKTYNVSNMFKKTFVEVNYMQSPLDSDLPDLSRITIWRGGTMTVTIENESEAELLQEAVDAGESYDDIFEFSMFGDAFLDSSWDGCSEDYESGDAESLAQVGYLREEFDALDDDEYHDFIYWLEEEKGYIMDDTDWSIEGPVEVELMEFI